MTCSPLEFTEQEENAAVAIFDWQLEIGPEKLRFVERALTEQEALEISGRQLIPKIRSRIIAQHFTSRWWFNRFMERFKRCRFEEPPLWFGWIRRAQRRRNLLGSAFRFRLPRFDGAASVAKMLSRVAKRISRND